MCAYQSLSRAKSSEPVVSEFDENTPLLAETTTERRREDVCGVEEAKSLDGSIIGVISVLLIADTSLVLASYAKVASEFGKLESGSWLLSSYMLAMCVAQPLYGKLSDIYGRKRCLQASYVLFALGTAGSGLGKSIEQVIAARAIQGTGGAGMVCMVSILLTDLVPLHEVAAWRSYVNIVQTVGRSCGGALGGFLTQTLGWRWAFLVQLPPTLLAIALVEWKLKCSENSAVSDRESSKEKLKRVDFGGAIALSTTILCALLVLDMGGEKLPWSHWVIFALVGCSVASCVMFCWIERYWAKEPIFPLRLLTHFAVVTSYAIMVLQSLSQTALMFVVPLYFQVTQNASPGRAGAYLVPAIVGNTLGGLATGAFIRRTRRYKFPTILACISSMTAFTCLILAWNGHTSMLQSFLIFPGGFGTGVAHSALFVGLASSIAAEEVAIASSGLYLTVSIGGVTGVSAANAIFQATLRKRLWGCLEGVQNREELIRRALSNVSFIQSVNENLRSKMMPAYVFGFQHVFVLGLASASAALIIGLMMRERRLAA